jgi:hypothetical protein
MNVRSWGTKMLVILTAMIVAPPVNMPSAAVSRHARPIPKDDLQGTETDNLRRDQTATAPESREKERASPRTKHGRSRRVATPCQVTR